MKFNKIDYENLNARQKEVFNFHKIAAMLADYGFNCLKLTDDWQGADFLAYQMLGNKETLKIQLKSRVTIDKKYLGKNIWLPFPVAGSWYLIEHDALVEKVGATTNWLNTKKAWISKGLFSSAKPSVTLLGSLADNKFPNQMFASSKPAAKKDAAIAKPAIKKSGIGARQRELILTGLDNNAVLATIGTEFPQAGTSVACVAWYRSRMRHGKFSAAEAKAVAALDNKKASH